MDGGSELVVTGGSSEEEMGDTNKETKGKYWELQKL